MKNLLYKEFKLVSNPVVMMFPLLAAAMTLIPGYPKTISVLYLFLQLNTLHLMSYGEKDVLYTTILPVRHVDVVGSRILFITIMQVATIALFALLLPVSYEIYANVLGLGDNFVGYEANPIFLGMAFVTLGIADLIYIPYTYKNPAKAYRMLIVTLVVLCAFTVLEVGLDHMDYTAFGEFIQSTDPDTMYAQVPLCILGAFIYALFMYLTYKKSCKNFEKYGAV